MWEKLLGALQGAGVLLLLLTAAASDMGGIGFGAAVVRMLLAGALILVGTYARCLVPRAGAPRKLSADRQA